ncbi:MAG: (Fe-S)-binding protein [Chloroflexota bacterium]
MSQPLPPTRPTIPFGPGPTLSPRHATGDGPDYDNVLACIRCGLCLSVCPTYATDGLEVQSPRGRVALIRAWQEGRLEISANMQAHMYHCLDCRACQTICPTGVRVGELVLGARTIAEHERRSGPLARLLKAFALRWLLPHPDRLERSLLPLRLYQRLGLQALVRRAGLRRLLPRPLAVMEGLLPPLPPRPLRQELPLVVPAQGQRRLRVGFFLGCVMTLALARASRATVEVLAANGCEVVTPKDQVCCGAPHAEEGEMDDVRSLARRNIEVFEALGVDLIVSDCAACGAQTKEYAHLLRDDPRYAERARLFSAKVRDIFELLETLPPRRPLGVVAGRVAYHMPCHLSHAQGVREAPRRLLGLVPGLQLVDLNEADWCCGSAGIYNISHAERAEKILERKLANLAASGAETLVTGNPGCLLQLMAGVREKGWPVAVRHPVELLAESYAGGVGEEMGEQWNSA